MPENLFEKLYDAEWNRRNELLSATSLPAGVLALLGTGLAALLRDYPSDGGLLDYAFWPLFFASCVGFVVALYMLVRSLFVGEYEQILLLQFVTIVAKRRRERVRRAGEATARRP